MARFFDYQYAIERNRNIDTKIKRRMEYADIETPQTKTKFLRNTRSIPPSWFRIINVINGHICKKCDNARLTEDHLKLHGFNISLWAEAVLENWISERIRWDKISNTYLRRMKNKELEKKTSEEEIILLSIYNDLKENYVSFYNEHNIYEAVALCNK
jgi:hypothetical protein